MYIEKIIEQNIGPINELEINLEFNINGKPKPLILVGENGTGKSTVLSNIVDSFYECASVAFSNSRQQNGFNGEQQFFKTISPTEIKVGKNYLLSYLKFKENSKKFEYIYKSGNLSVEDYQKNTNANFSKNIKWEKNDNYKTFIINKKDSEKIFSNNVICYFGPDRYEKPFWLGDKYYKLSDFEHPNLKRIYSGILKNNISVENMTLQNLNWLLDIIIDSRTAIQKTENNGYITKTPITLIEQMNIALKNVEKIMSKILGIEIQFGLNYRNSNASRFNIQSVTDNSIIIPTIDSLSTGQSALFHIFSTIIRYADTNNINNSILLNEISGIVVIDEIELHLHSNLQYEILPELINLFHNVQFIITTHSPLFLLGMKNKFSESGISIYNMPQGNQINTERFSEFLKSYNYLMETQKHEEEIKRLLANKQSKMIVITEGATDWKHMKAAYKTLKDKEQYKDIFDNLEFDFLEYEPKNSKSDSSCKVDMGDKELLKMCQLYKNTKHDKKYVFIFDRDNESILNEISTKNKSFKIWGNNIFSFPIPIPNFRDNKDLISIEHLYKDEVIKTPVCLNGDKFSRRLFLGNEFDKRGVSSELDLFCEKRNICGPNSLSIIEGSNKEKVTSLSKKEETNYALPKMLFADMILKKQKPFALVNFESFIEIFSILKEIQTI